MDYKNKYIKYKTKYLELKDMDLNNQIGGGNKDDIKQASKRVSSKIQKPNKSKLLDFSLLDNIKHYKRLYKSNKNIMNHIFSKDYKPLYFLDDVTIDVVKTLINEINIAENDKNIKGLIIFVGSGGGDTQAGLSLLETTNKSKLNIIVIIIGQCGSAATFIGVKNQSIIAPYSTFFIHQYNDEENGQRDELLFKRDIGNHMNEMFLNIYMKYSSITRDNLINIMQYDYYINSETVIKMGLSDFIISEINIINKYNGKGYENIDIIGASKWQEYRSCKDIFIKIHKTITDKIKPVVNVSDLSIGLNGIIELAFILPIINILAISPIKTQCVWKGPLHESSLLFSIVCDEREMKKSHFAIINFTNLGMEKWQPKLKSLIYSYLTSENIIINLFKKYTKLPENILNNLFTKRFILNSKECLKYGIVDKIYK